MISIRALRRFPIFEGLSDDELERIAALCREEVYEAGAVIHEEGTPADYLYIVQDGKVILELKLELQPYASPRRTTIEEMTKGQVFGWSSLVEPYTRTLSAKCVERTRLVLLKGSDLLELFEREPHIGYELMSAISKIVGSRLRDTREKLMSFLRGEELSFEYTPEEATLIERIRYFIDLRWVAAAGVVVLALFANYVLRIELPLVPVLIVALAIALYNLVFWLQSRPLGLEEIPDLGEKARRFAIMQSVADLPAHPLHGRHREPLGVLLCLSHHHCQHFASLPSTLASYPMFTWVASSLLIYTARKHMCLPFYSPSSPSYMSPPTWPLLSLGNCGSGKGKWLHYGIVA